MGSSSLIRKFMRKTMIGPKMDLPSTFLLDGFASKKSFHKPKTGLQGSEGLLA